MLECIFFDNDNDDHDDGGDVRSGNVVNDDDNDET